MGKAPGFTGHRFTDVQAEVLPGPPSSSGFCLLPLEGTAGALGSLAMSLITGDASTLYEAE